MNVISCRKIKVCGSLKATGAKVCFGSAFSLFWCKCAENPSKRAAESSLSFWFLTDRTVAYDRLFIIIVIIRPWHNPVVCLSVCLSVTFVHCGSQGWCTGLKVVPACSCRLASSCMQYDRLSQYSWASC